MKLIFSLTVFIMCLMLTGCWIWTVTIPNNWPQGVPDGDIIYESKWYDPYEMNFIQSDGTHHNLLNLSANFVKPIWSSDGTVLYGLTSFPTSYADIGYPAYWDVKNGKYKVCSNNLPFFWQIQATENPDNPLDEVILEDRFSIVLFDLSQCKEIKTIVDYSDTNSFSTCGFSFFPTTHELLFGKYNSAWENHTNNLKKRKYQIIKMNLITGNQVDLGEGIYPAWSPDGKQVAYIGLDGLYVMDADGTHPQQIIKRQFFDPSTAYDHPGLWIAEPRWSPDGQWLVYHQCIDELCALEKTPIYKIRVSDGKEVQITTGGMYPNWKPK